MATAALAHLDSYRKSFDYFISRRREPASILDRRREAMASFEAHPLPSTREEAWRFTDVSNIGQINFERGKDTPVDAGALPHLDGHHHRLVFINGRFAPGLSRLQALPDKALVASLGQALLTHPEIVEAHLGTLKGLEDNPFIARNSAFWEDGAFIYLPGGVVLEDPLHLIFYATGDDTVCHPRILLVMEESSQATVVTDYRGEGRYLTCPAGEIRAAQGAVLAYHQVQEDSPEAWHLGGLRLEQRQDSRIDFHLVSAGGLLTRTDLCALLADTGAECNLNGLTLVQDKQLGDQHVRVDHLKPHGSSRQTFKGVLADKGRTVFDGLIHVHEQAQKTNASQNNRNLLLSRQALANSNPRLEILADDVKCSHGSTVGFLDPDALFYLRSRGIGAADAEAMLVYAFANESLENIRIKSLRERLQNLLLKRFYPAAAERI